MTAHIAALCTACARVWVAISLRPDGADTDVVAARVASLTCPDCGASTGQLLVVGPRHAEAVARLRREAAWD